MMVALPSLSLISFEKSLWYTWEDGGTKFIYMFKRYETEAKSFKVTESFYNLKEANILASIITHFPTW